MIDLPKPAGYVLEEVRSGYVISERPFSEGRNCAIYTGEQVRAALLAERERICQELERRGDGCTGSYGRAMADGMRRAAAAIRGEAASKEKT